MLADTSLGLGSRRYGDIVTWSHRKSEDIYLRSPFELWVCSLRPTLQEIVPPDICWNTCLLRCVSEDSNTPRLWKLTVLVVQMLSRRKMERFYPFLLATNITTWEYDRVEWDVIFTHELIELDVIWCSPPFLPLLGVVSCDGDIANASIEPDIKDLVSENLGLISCISEDV